jgi:glycosyltransferase involved in cell wall biosynthesis
MGEEFIHNGMRNTKTLFVFTKEFPFGKMEQYLEEELKFMSECFNRVIFVPCEIFGDHKPMRELPEGFDVMLINRLAEGHQARFSFFNKLKILVQEFLKEKYKWRFIREFRRYLAVLNHQTLLASYFTGYLQENFSRTETCFYAYWFHNSCIMLGLMKEQKAIPDYVARAHSIDLYHNDWPMAFRPGVKVLPFQWYKMKTVSAVFSVSEAGRRYMENKFPRLKEKLFTSYLGVIDRGEGKYEEGEQFTMVSCAHVANIKQIPLIARVFSKLDFPARWVHFGDGPEMDEVRRIVSTLPVHLAAELKGHVSNETVMSFYRNNTVHLFINLSRMEGLPFSIMEAISFGIPVMAPAVSGIPEIVNDSTGVLVQANPSVEECVNAITTFYRDKSHDEKLRVSSRKFFLEKFNSEKNLRGFFSTLSSYSSPLLLEKKAARAVL